MAKVKDLFIGEVKTLAKCAVTLVIVKDARIQVVIPLEGLVDLEEEIKRLEKTIEKTQKELQSIEGKLSNANFVKNAPEEVVIQDKERLVGLRAKIKELTESQARLR